MKKLSLEELNRLSIEEYKQTQKLPITIVLDRIRSGMNVGSIFRTADGFGVEQIYLGGFTPTPPHREITKTAIGATQSVEWKSFSSTSEAIEILKGKAYTILGIEQTDESVSLYNFKWRPCDKLAVVFGNEVEGLDQHILPLLDHAIEIPQFGTKHSFNVSVCAGIVLGELSRQMRI
jgi:tRNA G18 (ribose-2'-O)-methylase SpoU